MEMVTVIKYGMVCVGLTAAVVSFWLHAEKRMTSDLAVAWCLLGMVIGAVGAVPVFSAWMNHISGWTALALFCVGSVCLWGAFLLSLLISRLLSQNQELAMQVSLLLRENEELLAWRREEAREDEADFVCR